MLVRKIKSATLGCLFCLLGAVSVAHAQDGSTTHDSLPDVGMIGGSHDSASLTDVGMIDDGAGNTASASDLGSQSASPAASALRDFFLHFNAGSFHRDLKNDSDLNCFDTVDPTAGCTSSGNHHGFAASVWGMGLGVRYNAEFALDFSFLSLTGQRLFSTSTTNGLKLKTWIASAMYQAQIPLGASFYWVPEVGVSRLHHRITGKTVSGPVSDRSVTWRPSLGLILLYQATNRFGVELSGLYIGESGHSPIRRMRIPRVELVTLGLRFAF